MMVDFSITYLINFSPVVKDVGDGVQSSPADMELESPSS